MSSQLLSKFEGANGGYVSLMSKIVDVDAHEMIPMQKWPEEFGDAAVKFTELCSNLSLVSNLDENTLDRPDIAADDLSATHENVWSVRGPGAPSAIDLSRRVEVLDVMGIDRQLIFPTFALAGVMLRYDPKADRMFGLEADVDRHALGLDVVHAHNDWVARTSAGLDSDRIRAVAVVLTDTVDQMVASSQDIIDRGARAIMIPGGLPPAGVSPADRALDPFWELVEAADVPVMLHIGTEFALLASKAWGRNVPEFAMAHNSSLEFPVEPYWGATLNFTHENFLTAMVLGGVFERFPNLRFGCIEVGAQWIGPFAERLDLWAAQFKSRFSKSLSMKPSGYLARNVRVGPFVFEDVKSYFDRYPDLSSVYCFSTDYPHKEGGKHSLQVFEGKLSDCDPSVASRFFVENGELLLPTR